MFRPTIVFVTAVMLALCWFSAAVMAAPGRSYGAPVYVGGGVRPIVARPGVYRAPVIYRPPVVVHKVIQPVIVPRPVPVLLG